MTEPPPRCPKWIGWCSLLILLIGCLQFAGYLLNVPALRGIGAACGFAPYTKVFSDVDGFETFAAEFSLVLSDPSGAETSIEVTPEFYQKLRGPYNRRNVYGAALSYAPRLPEELWTSVFCYGFSGPLLEEFEIPSGFASLSIQIDSRTHGRNQSWRFTPECLD